MSEFRKIVVMLIVLLAAPAWGRDGASIGTDAYGMSVGVTNLYYQASIDSLRAYRIAYYSSDAGEGGYGFYRRSFDKRIGVFTPYVEAGLGYASDTYAVGLNLGLALPVNIVTVEPYIGLVVGGNGTGYGVGFNVAYRF